MDLYVWIFSGIIIFIAALAMSIAGFGFGLIATPLLFLILDSRTVVVFAAGLGAIVGLLVLIQARQSARLKMIIILGISSLIGLPIGIYTISHLSVSVLKIIIGVLVVIFAVLLGLGYTYKFSRESLGGAISGFVGGMLMSGAGLGGPPIILFFLNQDHEKQAFRAHIAAFFVISGISSFAALGISGTVSSTILLQTITFIPLVILGYFIGIKILPHVKQALFKKLVLAIITISGVTGVLIAIFALTKSA